MTSSSRFAERSGYKIVGLSGRRAAPADWAAAALEEVLAAVEAARVLGLAYPALVVSTE